MLTFYRFCRAAVLIGLLLTIAVVVPRKILDNRGLERVERLREDLAALEETNARIHRENRSLSGEIKAFHSSTQYLEKVARDELGMVGPNDIIYQFPDERPSDRRDDE